MQARRRAARPCTKASRAVDRVAVHHPAVVFPDAHRRIPMEASRDADYLPHDGPLREDVGRLGRLVGRMLAEQGGEAFFQRVETVRQAAIRRRREGEPPAALSGTLDGLHTAEAEALARAFATYFQAVNTAERVHRIRRRRDYQREGSAPQPESLLDVLGRLKAEGVGEDELLDWLARLWIEPVF